MIKRPALPYPAQALRDREYLDASPKDTKTRLLDRLSQEYHDLQYRIDLLEARLNAVSTWQPESISPTPAPKPDFPALSYVQSATGQLRWLNTLARKYSNLGDSAGNISGIAWCNGVFLADGYFLTAGHCFDKGGGWQRPNHYGVVSSPDAIAPLFSVCHSAKNDRSDIGHTVQELVCHRPLGLDCAIVRLSQHNDTTPSSFKALELIPSIDANHTHELTNADAFLVDYQNSASKQGGKQNDFHSVKITQHQRSLISFTSLTEDRTLSGTPLVTRDGHILGIKTSSCEAVDIRAIAQILEPIKRSQAHA